MCNYTYRLWTNRLQHRSYHSTVQNFAYQRVMNRLLYKSLIQHQIGMPFQCRNSVNK